MKIPIEPERMNPRKIRRVVQMLEDGGVVAYPTDTVYGLGADMFERKAVDRIYRIKGKHEKSPLSFVCNDIKDISRYTIVSDHAYRLMRRLLPGPYTFILKASREVPRVMTRGTRTLGIRIPDHPVARGIVEELGHPIASSSVPLPDTRPDGARAAPVAARQRQDRRHRHRRHRRGPGERRHLGLTRTERRRRDAQRREVTTPSPRRGCRPASPDRVSSRAHRAQHRHVRLGLLVPLDEAIVARLHARLQRQIERKDLAVRLDAVRAAGEVGLPQLDQP